MIKNHTTNTREELYLKAHSLKTKLYTYDLTPNEHTIVDKALRSILTHLGFKVTKECKEEIKRNLMRP